MTLVLDVARVAAGLNVLLLGTLLYVWGRNYRQIRSTQTLGTLVFGVLLLAENVLALATYLDPPSMSLAAVRAMLYLQILETVALAFLAYVTWE